MPAGADALTLRVHAAQKGPLKVAIAHENLHMEVPTNMVKAKSGSVDSARGSKGASEPPSPTAFTDPYA